MVGLCLPTTCGACDAPHVRSRQPWGLPTPLPAGSAVLLVPSGGSGGGGLARRCPQPRARSSRSLECCSSRRAESNLQCDNAAQGSSGSSGGTGGGDGSQRPRRRGKTGRKREDFAFCISRADLSWEQPWLFEQVQGAVAWAGRRLSWAQVMGRLQPCMESACCPPVWPLANIGHASFAAHPSPSTPTPASQSAALPELHLREQGLAALDDAAAAAAERPPATASFRVQLPTGLGALVVDGTATAVSG